VRYLLAALKRDSVEPTEAAASSLPHVVPERILRTVVRRLEAMPPSASSLARAVAVFDGGVALVNAARLADLDVETARAAADILVAEEILKPDRPLEFVHPIVRQAVYSDLPPRLRMHYHRLAASMLVTDGAAPELSAGHLLRCYPAGEAWVVDVLRSAGRRALQRGSPDAAAAYFQRALEEPAEEKHRAGILWELGSAKAIGNEPDAADYLTIALEASGDLDERARIADELGRLLTVSGRADAAIDRLEPLLAEFQRNAPDLATRLAIDLGIAAWVASPPRPSLVDRLAWQYSQGDPHNGDHTPLIANCAFAAYAAGAPADFAAELAEKALAEGGFVAADADSPAFQFAVGVLTLTDRLELAGRLCDEAIETTRRRGSVSGAAAMSCWRSRNNLLRGAVSEAEADARVSLAVAREHGAWELGLPVSVAFLIDALIERGDLAAAEATLEESGLTGELPECLMSQLLLCARGRLRLLLGRPGAGIEDFLTCGSWQERWPLRAPGMAPWRTAAATALAAQGDRAQARQLVAEELEVTRAFGAPRPLAAALRAAAMVERGERGVELLREAVMVLEGSPARLETARVLIDLGALLRRVGRRREARETLRAGLDVAYHCGALALVELAREELVAVGVRPRRSALSGVDSLTPSELRVAKLATSGLTNPRIAQELFVTLRTVEMHLSNAYGKLGIRSRRELADALGHASERRELAGSGLRSA
jgi:DNA-binding CsgD family transcriptional regulator